MTPASFLDNFGTLADTPGGMKKLRELILQMAVRGQLVEQDLDDEPASELLKKIEAEKHRLVKEGKIKKDKPLPPVDLDHEPYELPAGWLWTRLGNVLQYGTPDKATLEDMAADAWVLDLEDVEKDSGRILQRVAASHRESKSTKARFIRGDILYGKLRPYLNKVIVADDDGFCTTEIVPLRQYLGLEPRYVQIALMCPGFLAYVNELTYGVKMPRLGTDDARAALMPLPPLAEQHRIVAKVDQLMQLCDELEAKQQERDTARIALSKTCLNSLTSPKEDQGESWSRISNNFDPLCDTPETVAELRKSILQLAVMGRLVEQDPTDEPTSELLKKIEAEKARLVKDGKIKKQKALPPIDPDKVPYELPSGWEWTRIGTASLFTEYGLSEKTYDNIDGVPVLKMGDIRNGRIILGGQKEVGEDVEGLPALYLKTGDVLYNRTNSAELVGKTGIYDGPEKTYTFASYLIRIRCHQGSLVAEYLNLSMNAPYFRSTQINPNLKQQCGQANVNGTIMRNMIVPLPPLAEQHRIVEKVEKLMALCDDMEAKLKQSQADGKKLMASIVNSLVEAEI